MLFRSLGAYVLVHHPDVDWAMKPTAWMNNSGYHGFTEMLYQVTSSNANNGSAYGGFTGNNVFWNVLTGIIIVLGRFLPIIGPIAIAGILAGKKYVPESMGTLKTDSLTFGAMTFAVIVIVTALSYFPPLALGPLAEYFSVH